MLPFYAERFSTSEINYTFYRIPNSKTIETWDSSTPEHFRFGLKAPQKVTHVAKLRNCAELLDVFQRVVSGLGSKLGPVLFQLPPSFHYTPARLKRILGQLDHRRRNVVEFRHKSWWNKAVYSAFRETGTIFCSCSGPRLPDELIKTADDIYIRFHGTKQWYRHDYTKEELSIWAKRIEESGARTVWAYFNNDRDCYAIKNARALFRLLTNPKI